MIASTMRSFEPVSTRRTFEEAVEQIAEQIKGGDLHTGDREWETVLPAGITEVRERGGFLVGTGPGVVVLLR